MNCVICDKTIDDKRLKQGKDTCSRICSMKKYYRNPENRKKHSDKIKKIYENQELRKKN